jgi:diguanylate cyclase (GGDEF)-like protein
VGVIMLDVDHFKRFNDEHGHSAGDALLKELAALLRQRVRASDIACRYGGEEFTVILPEAGLEDTRRRAEALRQAAAALQVSLGPGRTAAVTISQGVAAFPANGADPSLLLREADAALYRAKRNGRNRVEVAPEGDGPAPGGHVASRPMPD